MSFRTDNKSLILTLQKENNTKVGGESRGMEGRAGASIFVSQSGEPKDTLSDSWETK